MNGTNTGTNIPIEIINTKSKYYKEVIGVIGIKAYSFQFLFKKRQQLLSFIFLRDW